MTVKELIAELQKMPQDLNVYAEGEPCDTVHVENCYDEGSQIVRIFKAWDVEFVDSPLLEIEKAASE